MWLLDALQVFFSFTLGGIFCCCVFFFLPFCGEGREGEVLAFESGRGGRREEGFLKGLFCGGFVGGYGVFFGREGGREGRDEGMGGLLVRQGGLLCGRCVGF